MFSEDSFNYLSHFIQNWHRIHVQRFKIRDQETQFRHFFLTCLVYAGQRSNTSHTTLTFRDGLRGRYGEAQF